MDRRADRRSPIDALATLQREFSDDQDPMSIIRPRRRASSVPETSVSPDLAFGKSAAAMTRPGQPPIPQQPPGYEIDRVQV